MTMVRKGGEAGWKAGSMAALLFVAMLPRVAGACEPGQVVAEVGGADAERYKAMENGDLPTLARYLGDDLIYTHSSAVVDSKEAYIDSLRSGKVVYKQTRRSDLRISPYGCTAVMTGRGDFSVSIDGKPVEVQLRFTNVWVKNPEGWQMVAWEATRIPPRP
jgi:ketosteroid isomerase-like protein